MTMRLVLWNLTEPAMESIRETTKRADQVRAAFEKRGVTVRALYWTEGQYDGAWILEGPDDPTLAAAILANDALGNIRTQTLRAYDEDEIKQVVQKL
jgi:uncharacterized protein with GYD domain